MGCVLLHIVLEAIDLSSRWKSRTREFKEGVVSAHIYFRSIAGDDPEIVMQQLWADPLVEPSS